MPSTPSPHEVKPLHALPFLLVLVCTGHRTVISSRSPCASSSESLCSTPARIQLQLGHDSILLEPSSARWPFSERSRNCSSEIHSSPLLLDTTLEIYFIYLQSPSTPSMQFNQRSREVQHLWKTYEIDYIWPHLEERNCFIAYGRRSATTGFALPANVLWTNPLPMQSKAEPGIIQYESNKSKCTAESSCPGTLRLTVLLPRQCRDADIDAFLDTVLDDEVFRRHWRRQASNLASDKSAATYVIVHLSVNHRQHSDVERSGADTESSTSNCPLHSIAASLVSVGAIVRIETVWPLRPQAKWASEMSWHGTQAQFLHRETEFGDLREQRRNLNGARQVIGIADFGLNLDGMFLSTKMLQKTKWTEAGPPSGSDAASIQKVKQYVQYDSREDSTFSSSVGSVKRSLEQGVLEEHQHGSAVAALAAGLVITPDNLKSHSWHSRECRRRCWDFTGVAPGAQIAFFDLKGCNIPTNGSQQTQNNRFVIPGLDLGTHVLSWAYEAGARIHLNAWTVEGGSEGARTGYDWLARDVDRYMYERPDTLVISAAGDQSSVVSPGLAKNGLTVGATYTNAARIQDITRQVRTVNNTEHPFPQLRRAQRRNCRPGDQNLPFKSARGPTADGRVKPDLVAPGVFVTTANSAKRIKHPIAAFDVGCADLGNHVTVFAGSSMAAAVVSGLAAIVRQAFLVMFKINPSGSLVKAALIHSAQPIVGPRLDADACPDFSPEADIRLKSANAPNGHQGFGRAQLDRLIPIKPHSSHRVFVPGNAPENVPYGDPEIDDKQTHEYELCAYIPSTDGDDAALVDVNFPLTFTLVWTDPPTPLLSPRVLVNDLDLSVKLGDRTYLGNEDASSGGRDSNNPVEKIVLPALRPGTSNTTLTVRVHAARLRTAGTQAYSLIVGGHLRPGPCHMLEGDYKHTFVEMGMSGYDARIYLSFTSFVIYAGVICTILVGIVVVLSLMYILLYCLSFGTL